MRHTDTVVFAIYLALLLVVGLCLSRRRQSRVEFLLASRSMTWVPVGISVMVTLFNAMNYTAFSGEVFSHGLYVLLALPVFGLVAWPLTRFVIPAYHRMQAVSVYELLEKRFDRSVRRLASVLFIAWRLLWMATALYATGRILSPITGIPFPWLVVLAGMITTVYTVTGGMRAVMLTDLVQFVVLIGSIVIALAVSAGENLHGFAGIFRDSAAAGLLKPFYPFDPGIFSPDPRIRITLWSALIGTFTAFMARYSVDQMVTQRYFSARSLADAQRGIILSVGASVLSLVCLALLGLAMHAHAAARFPDAVNLQPLQYFARFAVDLPVGISGLLLAGLFASTIASVDSGIHSCATAIVTDFHREASGPRDEGSGFDRILTLGLGAAAVAAGCFVGRLGSIFEIANKIVNGLGSPLLALFAAGFMPRLMTPRGVFIGGALGAAWSVVAAFFIHNLALHYYAVMDFLVTLGLCAAFSLIPGNRPRRLR